MTRSGSDHVPFDTTTNRNDSPQAPRIVVAEDDPDMRDLLTAALHKDGYDVTGVRDGARLLVWMAAPEPQAAIDLIISDLRMPVSSGLQILRELRRTGRRTPFILITAFGDEPTRAQAEQLDAVFLAKPFMLETLRSAVRHLLSS